MELFEFIKTSISFLSEKRRNHPNTRLMRVESFNEIQETLEKFTGKPALTLLYRIGKKSVNCMIDSGEFKDIKRRTFSTMLKRGLSLAIEFNWVVPIDVYVHRDKAKFVFNSTFESALHKKVDYPVCAFLRGYFEELANLHSSKKRKCVEKKCVAKGDDSCVFEIK